MKTNKSVTLITAALIIISSCNDNWLEIKRDKALIVPATLKDMRLLLTDEINTTKDNIATSKLSSDDYFVTTERWQSAQALEQNAYIWNKDVFGVTTSISDWDRSYNQVLIANVVLDGLSKIEINKNNEIEWNTLNGGALFLRAKAMYNLTQSFAKPYNEETAETELGLPIRKSPDINAPITRPNLKETYNQITEDLQAAIDFLPSIAEYKTDASKPAALGLLARCFLSMRKYNEALKEAESCLEIYSTLLDYNTLTPFSSYRFPRLHDEQIYYSELYPNYLFTFIRATQLNYVPEELYNSYNDNDLRKQLYFFNVADGHVFKGTYQGTTTPFTGITTDEIYLIKAECLARAGEVQQSMDLLNFLLSKRFIAGTFESLSANSPEEAVNIILTERRKELLGRGLRWSDLRRLNQEPEHATTLRRSIGETEYVLPPNDPRYVLPIPEYVIKMSGIEQNIR